MAWGVDAASVAESGDGVAGVVEAALAAVVRGGGEDEAEAKGADGGEVTGAEEPTAAVATGGGVVLSAVAAALAVVVDRGAAHGVEIRGMGWREGVGGGGAARTRPGNSS